jgi:hypothetical protein
MNRFYKLGVVLCLTLLFVERGSAQQRADWLPKAGHGVMVHYLSDWQARVNNLAMDPAQWNKMINEFDVAALVTQLEAVGAGYLIFTIGQNSGYYTAPNKVYEKITGVVQHCSRRDLVADLAAALHAKNIKLIVYLPSGAPAGDSIARKALAWENGPLPNKAFQKHWEAIIREWSVQWGSKIDGWWFDGCYWPNIMYRSEQAPNFASFAAAARAGNPKSIVGFNPGVVYRSLSITPHEDYIAGEIDKPELISIRRAVAGKVDGTQVHVLSFLGTKWGMGEPRFTKQQVIDWTQQVMNAGGAMTWDVPVLPNGRIPPEYINQLMELKALQPK